MLSLSRRPHLQPVLQLRQAPVHLLPQLPRPEQLRLRLAPRRPLGLHLLTGRLGAGLRHGGQPLGGLSGGGLGGFLLPQPLSLLLGRGKDRQAGMSGGRHRVQGTLVQGNPNVQVLSIYVEF